VRDPGEEQLLDTAHLSGSRLDDYQY